jgi:hypothetical protein
MQKNNFLFIFFQEKSFSRGYNIWLHFLHSQTMGDMVARHSLINLCERRTIEREWFYLGWAKPDLVQCGQMLKFFMSQKLKSKMTILRKSEWLDDFWQETLSKWQQEAFYLFDDMIKVLFLN